MKHSLKKFLAAALLAPLLTTAQIPEPATVFYGQVLNRSSGQPALLTQGDLVWTVVRPDGKTLTLTAALEAWNQGRFSYRLEVPHEALTFGLTVSDAAVPLSAAPASCSHLVMTLDGAPANILAPGPAVFNVAQSRRAATYRLDLEINRPLADTSGDGLPDWWKTRYGVTDPNADSDADGWSNLQEFRNRGNPTNDNRVPTLASTEFWGYAEGRTQVPLDAVDADSAPASLQYTLLALPNGGNFFRHSVNPDGSVSDVQLSANDSFTQDDVNQGRLLFLHDQATAAAVPTKFTVALSDENPAHATNLELTLNVFRPDYPEAINAAARAIAAAPATGGDVPGLAFGESQMLINYFLSRDHGHILGDSARATAARTVQAASAGVSSGQDRAYVLMAGAGDDRLVGGTAADILVGGRGVDSLRGNAGADLFLIAGTDSGNATIEDFSVAAGDMLDVSRVLQGASNQLTNYVQLAAVGTNSVLAVNFAGHGYGFTNLSITLLGTHFTMADLRTLVDGDNLITGNKGLAPQVSITASVPAATQNGPGAGQFTLTRSGGTAGALTVALTISGSAVNGSSYELISSTATFAAGQRTVTISVNPYLTTATLPQVAQISVATGPGYEAVSPATAQVTIEPLAPQLTIEAVEPYAIRSDLTPGLFLVTRFGILDRSVLVRLTIGGSAAGGTDYTAISTFLNLAVNQTAALISVTPKSTGNLAAGAKFVQLSIRPDAAYKIAGPGSDRVFLVEQLFTRTTWQRGYFPDSTEDWASFATRDPGNTGINNLQRYAFGLNPTNPAATAGLPFYRILDDHLAVTFRRPLSVTDFDYLVQVSADLTHWSALGSDVEVFTPANASTNDLESVSFRGKAAVSGTPKQFMRVQLQPR